MSQGKKISDNLKSLVNSYKQLPYTAIKKNTKYYLIPHRPRHPITVNFNIAKAVLRQHSEKYNQHYSSEKLSEKIQQKIMDVEVQKKLQSQMQYKSKLQNYYKAIVQWKYKYIQPLKIIRTNSYNLFKTCYFSDIKLNSQKVKSLKNQNEQLEKPKDKQTVSKKGKNYDLVDNINKLNFVHKWNTMSLQQKKYFQDMQHQLKAKNQKRLQQFLFNHSVPVVRNYSTIGRFISRYSVIYQLKITDKLLYKKYRQLPETQRNKFTEEAKQKNRQEREKYQIFLDRWNLTKQQLNHIIDVSDKYKRLRLQNLKNAKRISKQLKRQYELQGQKDQTQDFQIELNQQ